MMESLGCSYAALERGGLGLPVRKAALRFRRAARYDEELSVRTRVEHVGGASVSFRYEVRSGEGELVAEGTTELACVELANPARAPRFLPEDLRALLEAGLRPTAP
jgi:acyl-CoA thioester hydrolase